MTVLVLLFPTVGDFELPLPWLSLAAAGALAALAMLLPRSWKDMVTPALIVVILWQPFLELREKELGSDPSRWGTIYRAHGDATAAFLNANPVAAAIAVAPGGPHRYIGYEPALLPRLESEINPYRAAAHQAGLSWLLVNNWATWFGLDSSQGYNALQVKRYMAYVRAMNGRRQEYHGSNVFPGGLASPLFALLNVRYLIVPAATPNGQTWILSWPPCPRSTPTSTPASWRTPRPFRAPGWCMRRGRLPRKTPSPCSPTARSIPGRLRSWKRSRRRWPVLKRRRSESIAWDVVDPDHLALRIEANAPALLVLSEVWDPNWTATVDGEPAPVLLADYTLRAVPVPAGAHEVALRYDPPALRVGLAVTLLTAALLALSALVLFRRGARASTALWRQPAGHTESVKTVVSRSAHGPSPRGPRQRQFPNRISQSTRALAIRPPTAGRSHQPHTGGRRS